MSKLTHWPPGGADTLYHWCPACERLHVIPPNRWTRTGPDESPTYSPSFLQEGHDPKRRCHYFITDGRLQLLPDSWHGRNETVPMPDIPEEVLQDVTEAIFKR